MNTYRWLLIGIVVTGSYMLAMETDYTNIKDEIVHNGELVKTMGSQMVDDTFKHHGLDIEAMMVGDDQEAASEAYILHGYGIEALKNRSKSQEEKKAFMGDCILKKYLKTYPKAQDALKNIIGLKE